MLYYLNSTKTGLSENNLTLSELERTSSLHMLVFKAVSGMVTFQGAGDHQLEDFLLFLMPGRFFFWVPGIEPMALCLLGKHPTT
jgi:hypothetical protein